MSPRLPRNYNGNQLTSKPISHILPSVLNRITANYQDKGELILAAWPQIIGDKLAPMTKAVSYRDGVLTVQVKNSTLFSLLNQHEKPRLLAALQKKFPRENIKTLLFRMG
jgi:hypothetical protein